VQREADLPQERLRGLQLAQLAARQETVLDQLVERSAPKWRLATQPMVWMSRRPPGLDLTLGSRLYAVS
jgi:hypothetical protein